MSAGSGVRLQRLPVTDKLIGVGDVLLYAFSILFIGFPRFRREKFGLHNELGHDCAARVLESGQEIGNAKH